MSDVEYEGTPDEEEGVENDPEQSGDSEEEDDDDDDDDVDVRLGGDRDATFEDGYAAAGTLLDPILNGRLTEGRWNPEAHAWTTDGS